MEKTVTLLCVACGAPLLQEDELEPDTQLTCSVCGSTTPFQVAFDQAETRVAAAMMQEIDDLINKGAR